VETLPQVFASGAVTGAEYALAAVGLTLIFGVGRVLNLAHGAFFALGAYIAYQATVLGFPAVVGAAPAAAAGMLLGVAVERVLVRPLRAEPFAAATVLLGFAILAEEGFSLVWGAASHSVPLRLPVFLIGRIALSAEQMLSVVASVAALGIVALSLRTKPGLALRAIGADAEIAQLAGVDVGRFQTAAFGVACGMAAVAGAFLSPLLTISPTMGRVPLALSLAMVATGGPGGIWGTLAASIGIGLAWTFVGFYLAPAWSYILALVLMAAALILRANGALGRTRA
jgi:branched-chain amino acid transport system permease protein